MPLDKNEGAVKRHFFSAMLFQAGGAQIDPRDDSRVPHPFVFGFCLPAAGRKGWVLLRLRFGLSLANLSLGLVRHHRPALHDPFHVVQSTLISALTRDKV